MGELGLGAIFIGIVFLVIFGGILLISGFILFIHLLIVGSLVERLVWVGAIFGVLLIFFGLLAVYGS